MRKFLMVCSVAVFSTVVLVLHYLFFYSSLDEIQNAAAVTVRSEGEIFLRNDKPFEPVQIHQSQMGIIMVCMSTDLTKAVRYMIIKRLFLAGKPKVLIRCKDGKITIGPVRQA